MGRGMGGQFWVYLTDTLGDAATRDRALAEVSKLAVSLVAV
jgi:hypothetical protein